MFLGDGTGSDVMATAPPAGGTLAVVLVTNTSTTTQLTLSWWWVRGGPPLCQMPLIIILTIKPKMLGVTEEALKRLSHAS